MKPLQDDTGRVIHPEDWDDIAEQRARAHAAVNHIAEARGLPKPWPDSDVTLPAWLQEDVDTGCIAEWGVQELGAMRERLAAADQRAATGLFYTPDPVASAMSRFSLDVALQQVTEPGDPGSVLQVVALDPACGTGVFLVWAARKIATRYAAELAGISEREVSGQMIRLVLPEVMGECVFGIDIDPVAVDLARSVLWLETSGIEEITFMDRNVITGNALAGPDAMPPKLEERYPTLRQSTSDSLFDIGEVA
jgi:hypothetical protein